MIIFDHSYMNINIAAILDLGVVIHKLTRSMKHVCYESEHDCEFDFAQPHWFEDVDCRNVRPDGSIVGSDSKLDIEDPLRSLLIEKGVHDRYNAHKQGEEMSDELKELLLSDVYPTNHEYDELVDALVVEFNNEAQRGHTTRSKLSFDVTGCIYEMKSCSTIEKAYVVFQRYQTDILNAAKAFERLHSIQLVLSSVCVNKYENYFRSANVYLNGSRKYFNDGYHRILRCYVNRIDKNFQYYLGISSDSESDGSDEEHSEELVVEHEEEFTAEPVDADLTNW